MRRLSRARAGQLGGARLCTRAGQCRHEGWRYAVQRASSSVAKPEAASAGASGGTSSPAPLSSPAPVPSAAPATLSSRPDHRTLATAHNLFTVSEYSPGSPLILPNGAHIVNKLISFLRAQYKRYGFQEVLTPNIYKKSLWQISGHWQNYKDDMYSVFPGTGEGEGEGGACGADGTAAGTDVDEGAYGLKPMNCPGHCLLMRSRRHTYKELPVRYADFSALHRNEVSGSLSGLTRVRRFHQDDAHIFCRPHQIASEIDRQLRFTESTLRVFGLTDYRLVLSTRPRKDFIGSRQMWDDAEAQLAGALRKAGRSWTVNEGDGAFYGPKIDLQLKDSDGKYHQLSTIQLDMNLPQRFGINYVTAPGEPDYDPQLETSNGGPQLKTPVLIHRAIFGSLERFFALLIEHYDARWPFWLSYNQAVILTVNDGKRMGLAARKAAMQMSGLADPAASGDAIASESEDTVETALSPSIPTFQVNVNGESDTLSKKVVQARKARYNFIFVLGTRNLADETVDVDFSGQAAVKGFAGMEQYLKGLDVVSFDASANKMRMKIVDVYTLFLRLERAFQ